MTGLSEGITPEIQKALDRLTKSRRLADKAHQELCEADHQHYLARVHLDEVLKQEDERKI